MGSAVGWGNPSEDPDGCWGSVLGLGDRQGANSNANFNKPLENIEKLSEEPSKNLNITYWATVESGNHTIHIPIDSKNVSGPEKTVITKGMKKVWKWAVEKDLRDKVGLQDVYGLAKEMHDDEEEEVTRCFGWGSC